MVPPIYPTNEYIGLRILSTFLLFRSIPFSVYLNRTKSKTSILINSGSFRRRWSSGVPARKPSTLRCIVGVTFRNFDVGDILWFELSSHVCFLGVLDSNFAVTCSLSSSFVLLEHSVLNFQSFRLCTLLYEYLPWTISCEVFRMTRVKSVFIMTE